MLNRLLSSIYGRSSPRGKRELGDLVARDLEAITYRRLAQRGFCPSGIIDVGAYEGNWTRLANSVFGAVPTLMIEAQVNKVKILQRVVDAFPNVQLSCATVSDTKGQKLTFYQMETGSSLLPEQSNVPRIKTHIVTRTLDDVASGMSDNLFLKIDVQGAELLVLQGGLETLNRSELVQLEVAVLQYNKNAPLMTDVLSFMADKGWYPIEIAGLSRINDVLVQMDLLFTRKSSFLRKGHFEF